MTSADLPCCCKGLVELSQQILQFLLWKELWYWQKETSYTQPPTATSSRRGFAMTSHFFPPCLWNVAAITATSAFQAFNQTTNKVSH